MKFVPYPRSARFSFLPVLVIGGTVFLGTVVLCAGPAGAQTPGVAPVGAAAPLPKALPGVEAPAIVISSQGQVQELLRNVDAGNNATALWGGYFARNGVPSYPGSQGLAYAAELLAKEPRGSARWLLFQYLRSYSISRYGSAAEGRRIYADAFAAVLEQPTNALTPAQGGAAGRIVAQYLSSVSMPRMGRPEARNDAAPAAQPGDAALLASALRCFATLPAEAISLNPPLNWAGAAKRADRDNGSREQLRAVAESVAASKPKPAPGVLLAAGEVLLDIDPNRAEAVLQGLAAPLPTDAPAAKAVRLRARTALAEACARRGQWARAVQFQQGVVAETGNGYPYLASLIYRGKDLAPMQAVVDRMKSNTAPEADVLTVAGGLTGWAGESGDKRLWDWAKQLYLSYLQQSRQRSADFEMAARDKYVRAALQFDNPDAEGTTSLLALASVDPPQMDPRSRPQASLHAVLETTRALLQERLKNMKAVSADTRPPAVGGPAPR